MRASWSSRALRATQSPSATTGGQRHLYNRSGTGRAWLHQGGGLLQVGGVDPVLAQASGGGRVAGCCSWDVCRRCQGVVRWDCVWPDQAPVQRGSSRTACLNDLHVPAEVKPHAADRRCLRLSCSRRQSLSWQADAPGSAPGAPPGAGCPPSAAAPVRARAAAGPTAGWESAGPAGQAF